MGGGGGEVDEEAVAERDEEGAEPDGFAVAAGAVDEEADEDAGEGGGDDDGEGEEAGVQRGEGEGGLEV